MGRDAGHLAGSRRRLITDLPLIAEIEVDCPQRYVPLRDDNSLQQLIQQPEAFARVVKLIADKSQMPAEQVREKLIRLAPDLFCGLLIALTEFPGAGYRTRRA